MRTKGSDFFGQIEALNQRGGRMLGIVDLIEANTLDAELAAHLWEKVDAGCSFLTAARPGGAGKSTVLANMLNFLPAETPIRTVASGRDVPGRPDAGACYLAHEIGSGPYFSYLWGGEARRFFEIASAGGRVASCLHADTLDELESILTSHPNALVPDTFASIGLLVFIHVDTESGVRRRVSTVYEHDGRRHALAYRWDQSTDTYLRTGAAAPPDPERVAAILSLQERRVRDFRETREQLIGA